MSAAHMQVRRMSTSRRDETRFEHYVQIVNERGQAMDLWMRHDPAEALYLATDLGRFLGIAVDPLEIDGKRVEMDVTLVAMLHEEPARQALADPAPQDARCHADRDGDCRWSGCPQLRDGEPEKSGRHCPIDHREDDD